MNTSGDRDAGLPAPQGPTLRELAARVQRKKKLLAMIQDLSHQADGLSRRVEALDQIRLKEQADVDQLERAGLSRLFYQFAGTLEEKLDRELAQALAAALEYQTAAAQLQALEEDAARCQRELAELFHCETDYQRALEARARTLKGQGSADAEAVCRLEAETARLEAQGREIEEAISAAQAAMVTVNGVQNTLNSAEDWGTWDLLGGGLLSSLAKHSHLDEAQHQLSSRLQIDLRRLRSELLDVDVSADFQISIDGFLRFADFFFDGLFADWAVLDRIHDAQQQVNQVDRQIQQVLEDLRQMRTVNRQRAADRRRQLEELLIASAT